VKKLLCLILSLSLALACIKEPYNSEQSTEFSFYLLSDITIKATEASKEPMNKLTLADEPIINGTDLNFYRWKDHSFTLKKDAEQKICSLIKSNQSVFGIPFIVMVESERIYLGSFWFSYSSVAPTFPHIDVIHLLLNKESPIVLKIEKSWMESPSDKRNDERIYQSLKSASILIE